MDQNTRPLGLNPVGKDLNLESGALDRSAILTTYMQVGLATVLAIDSAILVNGYGQENVRLRNN